MRLTLQEQSTIGAAIHALDSAAEIYLFGSRAQEDVKGGDIDLLVLSETLKFSHKISILTELSEKLGDQKIDLLIKPKSSVSSDPFVIEILKNAKRLPER